MPSFEYIALDTFGKKQRGVLEADSTRHVSTQLRERHLKPLTIKPATSSQKMGLWNLFAKRGQTFSSKDLTLLTRHLATLLSASMPLEEAIQAVAEQSDKPATKNLLLAVRAKIREGLALADALKQFPRAFPSLYCATVAAAEQSGNLDNVLMQLADYLEHQQQIQAKIKQALIYPSVMLFVSFAIISFLLAYVVPSITGLFSENQGQLPAITTFLIALSTFIQTFGIYILILLALLFWVLKRLLHNPIYLTQWHNFLLSLPIIGNLLIIANIARFSRTFAILETAAVPLLNAMQVAANVVNNIIIKNAILSAINQIREGISIHRALQQTGFFTPITLHLIANGENSGQLAPMLERVANQLDQEINRTIDTGLALFEPLLILIMGTIVLFIVLAVLLPIFNLDQLVG